MDDRVTVVAEAYGSSNGGILYCVELGERLVGWSRPMKALSGVSLGIHWVICCVQGPMITLGI